MAERLAGGRTAFNVTVEIALDGPLVFERMERAIREIASAHPSLEGVWSDDGSHRHGLPDGPPVSVENYDFSGATDVLDQVAALRESIGRRSFALTAGPLSRFALVHVGPGQHRLLAVFHRSVFDGDSINVFVEALCDALDGKALKPVAAPLAVDAAQTDARCEWWRNAILPLPQRTRVASDRAGAQSTAVVGSRVERSLPVSTTQQLRTIARAHSMPASRLVLAAWAEVVRVHAGVDSVIVGVAATLRDGQPNAIDSLETELPYRYELDRERSFRQCALDIHDWNIQAEANRLPVDTLVDAFGVNRDPDQPPLTGVLFSDRPLSKRTFVTSDLSVTPNVDAPPAHDYDLRLAVVDNDSGLGISLDFDPSMYDEVTIVRILRRLEFLLATLAATPDAALAAQSIVPPSEASRLVKGLNDTEAVWPDGQTLHGLFEQQVDVTPDAIALRFFGDQTSYGELEQNANRIARWLIARGVEPGDRVAFAMRRSPRLIATMLGILKAGAAYVAIDPAHPEQRIRRILDDCGARLIVSETDTAAQLPEVSIELVAFDTLETSMVHQDATRLNVTVSADSPACIIYTSGSTGIPKGVVSPHSGYVNVCYWAFTRFEPRENEIGCIKTTPGFADSVWEIFGALAAGIESVIVPDDAGYDPQRLLDILSRERVTRIILVPSLLRALLDTGRDLGREIPHLTLWFPGGEATPSDLCRKLMALLPRARVINNYGCSEACAVTSWYLVGANEDRSGAPIGAPIINTRVYVLDENFKPVPEGAPGELYIAGAGLATGYNNDPEMTDERFVEIEITPGSVERVYRTGDQVRWLSRGALEYLGRLDKQVQIRGFRIELTEIESVLRAHPDVREAVVITAALGSDSNALVAYVVPRDSQTPGQSELREWCRSHVPGYMVPRAISTLAALPLNQNGKVDRSKLPDVKSQTTHGGALDDETLTRLIEIFADVLGVGDLLPDDDFFELGGHSLLAAALSDEIEQVFELPLELAAIYESPTPRELASHLRSVAGPVSLVRLNKPAEELSAMPVYCVFGLFLYRDLAERLREHHPVFGGYVEYEVEIFRSIMENADRIDLPLVEELAERYVQMIHASGDGGPYCLAGASFGGVVAVEIARRLREMGDQVSLVALFDSPYPSSRFHNLRELGRDFATSILLRGGSLSRSFRNRFTSGAKASFSHDREELRQIVLEQAMRRFVPQPYDGPVVLFRATENDSFNIEGERAAREWAKVCGGDFQVVDLPGGHLEILMEPRAERLADELVNAISQHDPRRRFVHSQERKPA